MNLQRLQDGRDWFCCEAHQATSTCGGACGKRACDVMDLELLHPANVWSNCKSYAGGGGPRGPAGYGGPGFGNQGFGGPAPFGGYGGYGGFPGGGFGGFPGAYPQAYAQPAYGGYGGYGQDPYAAAGGAGGAYGGGESIDVSVFLVYFAAITEATL